MYKLILCWRYLRTRYIALASIVSVMLGVATMIVVNSVMAGFTVEMEHRIHGILSDITFASVSLDGVPDAERHMRYIRKIAGQYIKGMSPTVHVPAMLTFQYGGENITRPVSLIGIDEATYASVGDFGEYLQHPANRKQLSFLLREGGYDVDDQQSGTLRQRQPREQLREAGGAYRRRMLELRQTYQDVPADVMPDDPFYNRSIPANELESRAQSASKPADFPAQLPGAVLGIGLATYREHGGAERFLVIPGDDVRLTYPTSGPSPDAATNHFTIVDFYESKMSEYDASFVFVPLAKLQDYRGMIDPSTDIARFTSIQIKVKPGVDIAMVRDLLQAEFDPSLYAIKTWRDDQAPLLAAVQMETAVLNVLLFLIIAVAGFGILAIFFMIVVEKTRDIGILKSLGASARGVMGIFVGYGVTLGIVGAGVGLVIGLLFVRYINEIAELIGWATGRQVFDPSMYYFYEIPTIVNPWTVSWIALGAIAIAVLASILPARRAARLHPVEALRYE
jgi:lipoprotein-releasing system permease protein